MTRAALRRWGWAAGPLLAWALAGCVRVVIIEPAPTGQPAISAIMASEVTRMPLATWTPSRGGVQVVAVAASGATPTPSVTVSPGKTPRLSAMVLADMNLPPGATVQAGEVITKRWRVRNDGTEPWPQGTRLKQVGGERHLAGSAATVSLVGPGVAVELAVEMRVPERPGTYQGRWQLVTPMGEPFGEELAATLLVVPVPTVAVPLAAADMATPSQMLEAPTRIATAAPPSLPSSEPFFTYEWDGGWVGFENQGMWIELSGDRYYVGELGLVDAEWVAKRMEEVGYRDWRFKIVVSRHPLPYAWSPKSVQYGPSYSFEANGAQRVVTNHIYLDEWRWRSFAERWLAGGLEAVAQDWAYVALQEAVFAPLDMVPPEPCLGFRFTEQ